jgi:hypothetical protein
MLELIVEHQAGIPLLMHPLSGNSRDVQEFGQVIRTHIEPWHTTYGVTYIVAASALYSEANLQKLAQTAMKWITRVPATLSEAQAALAQVDPQALASLQEGYRYHEWTSTDGGIAQRWVLIYAEPRQLQAQRTIDRQRRQQSEAEVKALKKLCRSTFACEADARQALATFEQDLQATCLRTSWIGATPRYKAMHENVQHVNARLDRLRDDVSDLPAMREELQDLRKRVERLEQTRAATTKAEAPRQRGVFSCARQPPRECEAAPAHPKDRTKQTES